MDNDTKLIFEKYDDLHEGLFSRLQAQGAGAVGAVKGLGNKVAGSVKGAVAGLKGDVKGFQDAQQQRHEGDTAGQLAKIESYRQTALSKIKNLTTEIFDDMAKLGIDVKKVSPNSVNMFTGQLDKSFENLINSIKTPAAPTAPAAPTKKSPPKSP